MKKLWLLFAFVSLSMLSFGQKSEVELKSIARQIITESTHCNLITVDEEGRPRVRVMDAFPPENDFTVWLATNPRSRKVQQIRNNANATLYYLTPDRLAYVMILGKAELIEEADKKQKYWKDGWESFYPNKKKDMILMKVTPQSMEIVSYPQGLLGNTETWQPTVVEFR